MKTVKLCLALLMILLSTTTVVYPDQTRPQAEFALNKLINKPYVTKDDFFMVVLTFSCTDCRPTETVRVRVEDQNPDPEFLDFVDPRTCEWEGQLGRAEQRVTCRMRVKKYPDGPPRTVANVATLTVVGEETPSATAQAYTNIRPKGVAYVPGVYQGYALPLENGEFMQGLEGWMKMKGDFNGHGTGLEAEIDLCTLSGGVPSLCAKLGAENAENGHIPVGYGYIVQAFAVQKPRLHITYNLSSYDKARSSDGDKYFDTFEVSVNKDPTQITDAQRNALDCHTSEGIPPTTPIPVTEDGLVFCTGGVGSKDTLWTSDWQMLRLDLSAYQDKRPVQLYLALWSREYDEPWTDDRAFYNTWVSIDRIVERP